MQTAKEPGEEEGPGGREPVRVHVTTGPEPGWWEIAPAWALRKVGAAPGEPPLLALDRDDVAELVGPEALEALDRVAPVATNGRRTRPPRTLRAVAPASDDPERRPA